MSIESINEQLLRSVGVGVALFSTTDHQMLFSNEVFQTWFGEPDAIATLETLFPDLNPEDMVATVAASGRYEMEIQLRRKRRSLVIAQTFSRAVVSGEAIYVLECQNISRIRELESMIDSYSKMVERNTREIQREKEQVEKLLLNVMPRSAYEEYKDFGAVTPQRYEGVSVLVLNFIDFTERVDGLSPATLVSELNEIYTAFDRIGEQLSCERIRTSGDSYRCVAGMVDSSVDNLDAIGNAATRFVRYLDKRNQNADVQWQCRIGVGQGSAIGSVIGSQKYVFDIFGDAVNRAEQACVSAEPMQVCANVPTTPASQNSALLFEKSHDAGLYIVRPPV